MKEQEKAVQKLLIIDDHILFREGLVSLFRTASDFNVVDQAGSVQEGVEKALYHKPDIILMDFSLQDGTGLDATRAILDELPACKIIFLTVYESDENLFTAISLGAKGYMLKNISGSSLIAGLRALDQGELAMSRKMMSRMLEFSRFPSAPQISDIASKLSPREMEVLYELQKGASNLEIAERLYLSQNTVKHHVHSVLDKLGVENRRQAGALAKQIGLQRSRPHSEKK